MPEVFVSLGSNQDRENNIRSAVQALKNRYGELRLSPVYLSKSVGFDGDDFLNMVVGFNTAASQQELLDILNAIEDEHGRVRGKERFGPRSLDIDLILYGDEVSSDPVSVPRGDIEKYAFVLKPLADLVPEYRHPVSRESYASMWENFSGSRELSRIEWWPDT